MVRQYVGARYVPKFANPVAWTSGTSYEAMTIVTYNNSSYTSKIPVPATVGNPADNPDYWALTGNYNAQVEQYRQETETVSNNLTTEITNRENADTTLQGQITTEITNRENADTTLQGQITTEITNRETADATLQGQITTEITNRETADATLQNNIGAEAATRASADSNLQSQINQIVAPSGEAPSAAEVQNARIGADGVTYDTLGTAIRSQVGALSESIMDIQNNFDKAISHSKNILDGLTAKRGFTYSRTATTENNYSADDNGAIFPLIAIENGKTYSYKNIRPYFSSVLYSNGNRLDFDAINGGSNDGSFVAEDNGTLFLSVRTADVDNVGFYEGENTDDSYKANKLMVGTNNIIREDIIYVGSTRQIKGFIEAINKSKDGDTIIFDEETFDIVAELGQSWLDTYTYDKSGYGFYLGGGKKLIFPYGATVKFNYDGSNSEVHKYFSPINAGAGDFEIIGLHLFAKNCRYAIHDERATNESLYHHIFKDCHIELDNSNNPDWNSKQCIGGGLGVNGKINIENCVFNSVDGIYDVSYHNSASDHAKSFIAITNCWFENSCRFSWYGQSQRTTMILFNGNSVKRDITVSEEGTGSGAPYKNIIVKKWGNEIRQ